MLIAFQFGTSVGSGALTLKKALIVAGVCEMLGAISLGSRVRLLITICRLSVVNETSPNIDR